MGWTVCGAVVKTGSSGGVPTNKTSKTNIYFVLGIVNFFLLLLLPTLRLLLNIKLTAII